MLYRVRGCYFYYVFGGTVADAALDVLLSRLSFFSAIEFSLSIHCQPVSVSFLTFLEGREQDKGDGRGGQGGRGYLCVGTRGALPLICLVTSLISFSMLRGVLRISLVRSVLGLLQIPLGYPLQKWWKSSAYSSFHFHASRRIAYQPGLSLCKIFNCDAVLGLLQNSRGEHGF